MKIKATSYQLGKNISFNIVGNFVYLGTLWIITLMSVWILGYTEAGKLSVALSLSNIFIAISSYYLRYLFASDVSRRHTDEQYIMSRLFATLVSIFLCVITGLVIGYDINQQIIIWLFYIYKCEEMISDVFQGVMQRYDKLYYAGYTMSFKGVVSLGLFILVTILSKSLIIGLFVMCLVGLITMMMDIRVAKAVRGRGFIFRREDFYVIRPILIECFPLFIMGMCIGGMTSIPRLWFERLYSEEEMGFLSSISTIAVLVSTATSCAMTPIISKYAEFFRDMQNRKLRLALYRTLFAVFVFGLVCIGITFLWGDTILFALLGESIMPYSYTFVWFVFISVVTALVTCMNSFLTATQKEYWVMWGSILGLLVCLLMSHLACQRFYMRGVIYTQLAAFGMEFLLLATLTLVRFYRIGVGFEELNDKTEKVIFVSDVVVSIVIPVYNGEKYIEKCLESLIDQTYTSIEIVVVDDGSKDNTGKILDEFAKKDDRIIVIHQENAGAANARNTAISASSGKYLLFVDGDDYVGRSYVENMVKNAVIYKSDLVISGYTMVMDDGRMKPVRPDAYIQTQKEEWAYRLSSTWSRLYDVDFWNKHHIKFRQEHGARAEDLPVVMYANAMAANIRIVPIVDYFYVQHEGSAMNLITRNGWFKFPYRAIQITYNELEYSEIVSDRDHYYVGLLKLFAMFEYVIYQKADRHEKAYFHHYVVKLTENRWDDIMASWKKLRFKTDFTLTQKGAIQIFTMQIRLFRKLYEIPVEESK